MTPESENPFPLTNFSTFQCPAKDEFGFNTSALYIFGGQGRFTAKYNTLYSFEMTGITEEAIFKTVETLNTPDGRCFHTTVGPYDKKVYLFGGDTSGIWTSYSDELWELETTKMTWKKLSKGPSARARHSSCLMDGIMYVFGGYNGKEYFGDTWAYDIAKEKWKRIETTIRPHPREGSVLFAQETQGVLFLCSGTGVTTHKDIWKFDPKSEVWSQVYVKPPITQPLAVPQFLPCRNYAAFSIGEKFIFYGGETLVEDDPEVDPYLSDLLLFDTNSHEMLRCGDLNATAIYGHQVVSWREYILILGGFSPNLFGSVFHHTISSVKIQTSHCGDHLLQGGIFNSTLESIMKREDHQGLVIPRIVQETLGYLTEGDIGLFEGIFRKSGRHSETLQLTLIFENGMEFDRKMFRDPNSIAVVLKKFLSSLREPLLTFALFDEFTACTKVEDVKVTLAKLPTVNLLVAKRLFGFLHQIDKNVKTTLMGAENLRLLFNHTLLRSKSHIVQLKKEENPSQVFILLIKNYSELFEK